MNNDVVVITGTHQGIGLECAEYFLKHGYIVHGIDIQHCYLASKDTWKGKYYHHLHNVKDSSGWPQIEGVNILINNAGTQDDDAVEVNLIGTINATEHYGLQNSIRSICNLASVSAHNGAEFGRYVASKGGVVSYTKWTAKEIAKYGATCNSLSFGGVFTPLNDSVIEDDSSWDQIMSMTPLKKWMDPEECAEWIYFLTVVNKSCTAQDIIVDNGEFYNHTFVWKEEDEEF